MELNKDKVVNLYCKLAKVPNLTEAVIIPQKSSGYLLNVTWSQRNLESSKRVSFRKTYLLDQALTNVNEILTADVSKEQLTAISADGKYRAVLREDDVKSESKQFLEIWDKTCLFRSVDITALDLHGPIYADTEFRTFDFCPNAAQVVYVAEKKVPKSEAFYKRKAPKDSGDGDEKKADEHKIKSGNEYLYRHDWGEKLAGKVQTVICIYDIPTDKVTVLSEGFPTGYCPAQVKWAQDGQSFYGHAFTCKPRKLGLYACTNRENEIFNFTLDGKYKKLSGANRCVRSPRMSPNRDTLIWLERGTGGPHHNAMALMKLKIPTNIIPDPEVVVPIPEIKMEIQNEVPFYGIFATDLPQRCFSSDGKLVYFSTPKINNLCTYCVDLDSGFIQELTESSEFSRGVLDVHSNIIATVVTNIKTPHQIHVAQLSSSIDNSLINQSNWLRVSTPIEVPGLEKYEIKNMQFKQEDVPYKFDQVKEFSGVYFGPTNVSKPHQIPLIVYVHGGPHSCYTNGYALSTTLNANLGFAYLYVNYRGSTGFGQSTIEYLPSRVGTADVADVVLATKECLSKNIILDPARVVIAGGSHGGFLSLHLSGQHPTLYCTAVSLNPVVDIAAMQITSDIPDWCTVEAGSEFTQKGPLKESLLLKQRNSSPIVHAHNVKVPVLLMIGSKDLRVPPSQGMEMYQRLLANGVNVKMHLYEDNHSLQNVNVEIDQEINSSLWMLEHTIGG